MRADRLHVVWRDSSQRKAGRSTMSIYNVTHVIGAVVGLWAAHLMSCRWQHSRLRSAPGRCNCSRSHRDLRPGARHLRQPGEGAFSCPYAGLFGAATRIPRKYCQFGVKAMDERLSRLRSPQLGPGTVIMSSCKVAAKTPRVHGFCECCGFEPDFGSVTLRATLALDSAIGRGLPTLVGAQIGSFLDTPIIVPT
jgi:hypothetical protein